jgi:hypothetical protein
MSPLDDNVPSVHVPKLAQAVEKRFVAGRFGGGGGGAETPYDGDLPRLLRRCGKAKRKEQSAKRKTNHLFPHKFSPISCSALCAMRLALCYLITRSARASTDCGIVRPIRFAALRLITDLNFLGRSTEVSKGID